MILVARDAIYHKNTSYCVIKTLNKSKSYDPEITDGKDTTSVWGSTTINDFYIDWDIYI